MKKLRFMSFLLVAFSIGILIFSSYTSSSDKVDVLYLPMVFEDISSSGSASGQAVEIVLDTELPPQEKMLAVYSTVDPNVDDEYASALAEQLGFNSDDEVPLVGDTRLVYSYQNDDATLEIDCLDGSIYIYSDIDSDKPKNLPSDEKCIDIATDWLESCGMLPDNINNIEVHTYIEVEEIDTSSNNTLNKYDLATVVKFNIALNEYELSGCGAYVVIGDNSRILKVGINTPQFEEYTTIKLKSVEEALDTLRNYIEGTMESTNGIIMSEPIDCITNWIGFTKLTITNVSIQYLVGAGDYAQPIYVFEGQAYFQGNANVEEFVGKVDAVAR